ncbi:SCO0930 family lipoprotein [Streptomyces sp. 3214.6]|uniref:SCO0930 family lipoprotein n=1 Tax=Streptomyces sp. 3214.6 TaxID=1882757 RepID=UPI00090B8167|nr:SCO0930 family lipoprotein [Streptomyces sp. 3214.6]SHI53540.1 Predicted lipoprotein with conserved Yx(FWY)xxD motif [Streptomyces sp. 3214.6]
MKTTWRSASLAAGTVAVLALTAACGSESGTSASSQNVGATAPAGGIGGVGSGYGGVGASASASAPGGVGTGTDTGTGAQTAGAGELAISANGQLGKILTDSAGKTLYRFDADTAEPPKSNCDGDCATTWPPVSADDTSAGDGIDKSLLGEITRPDGTKQLTVGGWPAYYYAKDAKPGDTTGQGVGNKWFALAPDGKKAKSGSGSGSGSDTAQAGLSVRKDANLGDIVVDKAGMTVYRFIKDKAWPKPVSNCNGACRDKWPVVEPVDFSQTKGIQKKGYMNFTRSDGDKQQTINCFPIYTFSGDKAPGDINGQGVGGTWYAVAPNGDLVGAPKK